MPKTNLDSLIKIMVDDCLKKLNKKMIEKIIYNKKL